MSKDHKNNNWQQKNGQQNPSEKKSDSCGCPVGSGNHQHKGGSNRDERGKYNQPNNENKGNQGGNNGRKFENE